MASLLAIGNTYETLRRSTIPLEIEGQVNALEVRREKHPGVDDVHLLSVDGRSVHVDAQVASIVSRGSKLRKDPWSSQLWIDQAAHRLSPSRDSKGMLIAMPVILLVLAVLLGTRSRPPSDIDTD